MTDLESTNKTMAVLKKRLVQTATIAANASTDAELVDELRDLGVVVASIEQLIDFRSYLSRDDK